jgi:DNA-binding NarL/FixJ family response regulator
MLSRSSAVVSRVVVFDLSPLFRHALAELVRLMPGFDLVGETGKIDDVPIMADAADANFFILDLDAGAPALELLEILKGGRECRCVMTITVGR